jgi:hypothetical protein
MTKTWEQVRDEEKQTAAEVSALILLWKGLLTTESCPTATELLKWRRRFSYTIMTKSIYSAQEWCRNRRNLTHQQIARTAYVYMLNRTNQEVTKCQKTTKS